MCVGICQSLVFLAAVVIFYVADFWLMRRYDALRAYGSSRSWSYTVMAIIGVALVIVQPLLWPGLSLYIQARWGLLIQALGVVLMLAALSLHWWARLNLGQFYGEREEVQPGQHLVESGPYAYIRHPIYTSYFTLAIGLFLVNPAVPTIFLAIYTFVDYSLAFRREEKLLKENLPGYKEYVARTWPFVPGIGKSSGGSS